MTGFETLPGDNPASVLWCDGECCDVEEPRLRVDFERFDDALRFIRSEMPLGRRHTVWVITADRLLPPEQVRDLISN